MLLDVLMNAPSLVQTCQHKSFCCELSLHDKESHSCFCACEGNIFLTLNKAIHQPPLHITLCNQILER